MLKVVPRFLKRKIVLLAVITLSFIIFHLAILLYKPFFSFLLHRSPDKKDLTETELSAIIDHSAMAKVKQSPSHKSESRHRKSYLDHEEVWKDPYYNRQKDLHKKMSLPEQCRLSNCFDFSRCKPGHKMGIHIYPEPSKVSSISSSYLKILQIIESSEYYEPDASKACLFISRYDYLDRDPLSPDFQKNLPLSLPIDNGRNHILFNLYSGTWPDYNELDLGGLDPGYSILVKASSSYRHFRPDFDISLPLFSRNHPIKGKQYLLNDGEAEYQINTKVTIKKADKSLFNENRNLMVFKGKRYTHGIGGETRNMLHHLHNNRDVLIFTTCKHGKKWKDWKDERCAQDNQEYDKYDYQSLMSNATFCLVPRGRRLGSFRFLEALSLGCVPVLLSNNWVKPFEDKIDWSAATIDADERSLLQLPEILRSYDWNAIERFKAQSIAIYEAYFSSVERIVLTTIKILYERIYTHVAISSFLWNLVNPGFTSFAGAIWLDSNYSTNLRDYPGYGRLTEPSTAFQRDQYSSQELSRPLSGYTAVIYVDKPISPASLFRFTRNISKSKYLATIVIIWNLSEALRPPLAMTVSSQGNNPSIRIINPSIKTIHTKLQLFEEIQTDAILNLTPESTITSEELDFAFLVWSSFPHRIVGFTARDYYYNDNQDKWFYSSKWSNYYSIILLDSVFYHRYYSFLYTKYISSQIKAMQKFHGNTRSKNWTDDLSPSHDFETFDQSSEYESVIDDEMCIDLIFNFLVAHVTREAPIKVTQRKKTTNSNSIHSLINSAPQDFAARYESFNNRQKCFTYLSNKTFSYIPLVKSQVRFDPVLFKDQVSSLRKKYRKMEQVI